MKIMATPVVSSVLIANLETSPWSADCAPSPCLRSSCASIDATTPSRGSRPATHHAPVGAPYIWEMRSFRDLSPRRWLRWRLAIRSRDARNFYDRGLGLLFGQRRVHVLRR